MTAGNFNNSIGFPRLTNKPSGMFMTQIPVQNNAVSSNISTVQPAVSRNVSKKEEDNSNYFLGLAALAASVIAGIYIYKGRKPDAALAKREALKINHPHIKDNFFEGLGINKDELSIDEIKEYDLYKYLKKTDKDGNPIKKYHGVKRVESIDLSTQIHRTSFVDNENKLLAEAFRNENGEVTRYAVYDKEGRMLRDYDASTGLVHKNVYNKDGVLVRKVDYDKNGWSYERRYDKTGTKLVEEIEFGVNPSESDIF